MSPRLPIIAVLVALSISLLSVSGCGKKSTPSPLDAVKKLAVTKDYDKALEKCNEILRVSPDDYETLVARGDLQVRRARKEEAIADYSRAIELYPDRFQAFDQRYKLYREMAEREVHIEKKQVLRDMAAADYQERCRLDPDAIVAFKDQPQFTVPSLQKPPPGWEPGDTAEDVSDGLDPFDQSLEVVDETVATTGEGSAGGSGSTSTSSAAEMLSDARERIDVTNQRERGNPSGGVAAGSDSDEEAIRDRDLALGEPSDMTLPPHDEPEDEEPITEPTTPQVTRFDRNAIIPLPLLNRPDPTTLPSQFTRSNGPSTGIRSGGTRGDTRGDARGETLSPYGQQATSGYGYPGVGGPLQNGGTSGGFGQSLRTTGIRSGADANRSSNRLPSGLNQGSPYANPVLGFSGPTGFLPPSAQGAFGPRLGEPQAFGNGGRANGEAAGNGRAGGPGGETGRREASDATPRNGTPSGQQVLTTAIPGTSLIYGSGYGKKRQPTTYAPELSDPSYSPFRPRETGVQTLPELPR